MPTRRQFDMVILTVILVHPVVGLFKMWATRKASEDGSLSQIVGGAGRLVS